MAMERDESLFERVLANEQEEPEQPTAISDSNLPSIGQLEKIESVAELQKVASNITIHSKKSALGKSASRTTLRSKGSGGSRSSKTSKGSATRKSSFKKTASVASKLTMHSKSGKSFKSSNSSVNHTFYSETTMEETQTIPKSKAKKKQKIRATTRSMWSEERMSKRSDMLLTEEYDSMLRDYVEECIHTSSDDDSSIESDSRPPSKFGTINRKEQFLIDFSELPRLSDVTISEGEEEEQNEFLPVVETFDAEIEKDIGRFVHPLTGAEISLSSVSKISIEEVQEEEEEEVAPEDSSDVEFNFVQKDDDDVPIARNKNENFGVEALLEYSKSMMNFEYKIGDEVPLQPNPIVVQINEFVRELIDDVVNMTELKDEKHKLKTSFDKFQLFEDITWVLNEYEEALELNRLLNRRVVDHHKRSKSMRFIMRLSDAEDGVEMEKYEMHVERLDKALLAQTKLKEHFDNIMPEARSEVEELKAQSQLAQETLEQAIRSTLCKPKFYELTELVNKEINNILQKQTEISNRRLDYISSQAKVATLKESMREFQFIAGHIPISSFLSVQTEALALAKKVEEKNAELLRLISNCNMNMHILSHAQEDQQIKLDSLDESKRQLMLLLENNRHNREVVYKGKVDYMKIIREQKQMSEAGGLLDKPLLLIDYDETRAVADTQLRIVNALRREHNDVKTKLDKFGTLSTKL